MANELSESDRDIDMVRDGDSDDNSDSDGFYDYIDFAESYHESPRSRPSIIPYDHNHDHANNNHNNNNNNNNNNNHNNNNNNNNHNNNHNNNNNNNNNNNDIVGESFKRAYYCYPISYMHKNKDHLENGNRVILPASALESLVSMEVEFPMTFKISIPGSNHVSHCGVLEFTAEEGTMYLPSWMMTNLRLVGGEILNVENTSLSKGTYMKIQPHSGGFLSNLSNPKQVLEKIFKDFSCLTLGDTIMVDHENQHYHIGIVETKPNKAISLFETDCEVDFAQPLDYKEPKPTTLKKPNDEIIKDGVKEYIGFKPFTGLARRLDGQPCVVQPIVKESTCSKNKEVATISYTDDSKLCSRKSVEKAVCGKDDASRPPNRLNDNKTFEAFTGKKYSLLG